MNIKEYNFDKRQVVTTALLLVGLVGSLFLVQNRQLINSRASQTVYNDLEVREVGPDNRDVVCTEADGCIIKTLEVNLKVKDLEVTPTLTPKPTSSVVISSSLGYSIPFRDPTVRVADTDAVKRRILNSWPTAKIENWDNIVSQSIERGWNPAFVITLWMEESGAQGAGGYSAALGCDITHTKYSGTNINDQLTCLFNNGDFPNEGFADFMCIWGGDGFHRAPCTFNSVNPNFPRTIRSIYSELVPSGHGEISQ